MNDNEIAQLRANLIALRSALTSELGNFPGSLLTQFPIAKTVDLILTQRHVRNYDALSDDLTVQFNEIDLKANAADHVVYKKLVLMELMLNNFPRVLNSTLESVRQRYLRNFERIYNQCHESNDGSDYFFDFKSDRYLKNLGVSSLFIVPLGAQKVNKNKLPMSFLAKSTVGDRFRFLRDSILNLRGRSPFYDMHTDSQDVELIGDFSSSGWRNFLIELSELIVIEKDVLGAFGVGWFFDPVVCKVSPRLSYISELIKDSGGSVYRVGATASARDSALSTSPTRRSLYEQRLYIPCDYLAVWDRTALLAWAARL
jgi:hypothetical protein